MKLSADIAKISVVVIFFVAISLPPVLFLVQNDKDVSAAEKRTLSPKPALPDTLESLLDFPGNFEKYYNDHFGLRDVFLGCYAWGKELIGDSMGVNRVAGGVVTKNVIKGKEGWYFLNRVWDGDPLSDYRNIDLYSRVALRRATILFAAREHWLRKHGIRYLLFIAPNKHTIYSEYLPDYITKQGNVSAMDQLKESLMKYTPVRFVDVRDVLFRSKPQAHQYWPEEKQDGRLYWKTDSHWNGAGVDIVQYELATHLARLFPGLVEPGQRPKGEFQLVETTGDLAILMNNKSLKEKGPAVLQGFCSQASLMKFVKGTQQAYCESGRVNAMIFHDSFIYLDLKRYLADYFKTTLFLWKDFSQGVVWQHIPDIQPDIVIEEFAERFLPYSPDITGESYNDFFGGLFGRSTGTVYTMNMKRAGKGAKGYANQHVRVDYDPLKSVLNVQALNGDPQLYLPDITFKSDRFYVVKVEITVPARTVCEIFYSKKGREDAFPAAEDSVRIQVNRGANTVYLPLLSGELGSRLRVDPGTIGGVYRLAGLEIREVAPELIQ